MKASLKVATKYVTNVIESLSSIYLHVNIHIEVIDRDLHKKYVILCN